MTRQVIASVAAVFFVIAWYALCTFPRVGRIGRLLAPGWGSCERCRTPWRFVEGHVTDYTDWTPIEAEGGGMVVMQRQGCFPLCERCWRELGTPTARLPYYSAMLADRELRTPGSVTPELRAQVEAAVFEEGDRP